MDCSLVGTGFSEVRSTLKKQQGPVLPTALGARVVKRSALLIFVDALDHSQDCV
jgi:hypothetical protein